MLFFLSIPALKNKKFIIYILLLELTILNEFISKNNLLCVYGIFKSNVLLISYIFLSLFPFINIIIK